MPPVSLLRLSEKKINPAEAHGPSKGIREEREGTRSYFVSTHFTNEYVFHVNCAHKAYCNGLGQTLHFFGHANMPTCNQQTEKDSLNECRGILK